MIRTYASEHAIYQANWHRNLQVRIFPGNEQIDWTRWCDHDSALNYLHRLGLQRVLLLYWQPAEVYKYYWTRIVS